MTWNCSESRVKPRAGEGGKHLNRSSDQAAQKDAGKIGTDPMKTYRYQVLNGVEYPGFVTASHGSAKVETLKQISRWSIKRSGPH